MTAALLFVPTHFKLNNGMAAIKKRGIIKRGFFTLVLFFGNYDQN
ncbi:hypothetical protein MuYL_1917 [Mucilaginibacter xinganensis]|uniref:Uncharacterized protein n=1 Tax=Mucilaginibacter xinganensis TaxID=1234841 RepID=A0A223NVB3_9SPHI|nr:hypothetical protein MuYL_1917 [Mucilaginibacter xinganensis]